VVSRPLGGSRAVGTVFRNCFPAGKPPGFAGTRAASDRISAMHQVVRPQPAGAAQPRQSSGSFAPLRLAPLPRARGSSARGVGPMQL